MDKEFDRKRKVCESNKFTVFFAVYASQDADPDRTALGSF